MSAIALAIGGSALLSLYSSSKAADAQVEGIEKGTQAQAEMADKNLAFQQEMANQQREDFVPWRETGQQALQQIQQGINDGSFDVDPSQYQVGSIDVTQDPGYKFRLNQGIEALDKSAASRGRLLSGAQQKGVNAYAQNVASQEYGNAYSREVNKQATNYARDLEAKNRKFNILSGLSQGGQSSAAGQAQATSNLAQTTGNILNAQGQSAANAAYNTGAVRGGAYTDVANIGNQAVGNWLTYDLANKKYNSNQKG
jgi:hypothetical protein